MTKALLLRIRCQQHETKMRRTHAIYLACVVLVLGTALAWGQPTGSVPGPTGEWMTSKGYAIIRIVNCGAQLWGVVSWEARPGGIDKNNPDPNQRNRPTLGIPILLGMVQTRANHWDGQIYNSQDGHTYSASIALAGPDKLRVEGCFLAILCGGEDWTRVENPPNSQSQPQSPKARSTVPRPPPAGTSANAAVAEPEDVCLRLFGPSRLPH
jgi:uncharacterized protein (DUF2147 family)